MKHAFEKAGLDTASADLAVAAFAALKAANRSPAVAVAWLPSASEAERKKAAAQAKRAVDAIRKGEPPAAADAALHQVMAGMVLAAEPSRAAFEKIRREHRRQAEKLAASAARMASDRSRGRIMGIIADALLRAQWRGEKDGVPAHSIGPFGAVYGEAKARQLAAGKSKGRAEKLARRAMIKALIHDVHAAWHGKALAYAAKLHLVEAA